ncbi:hypothetical protein [Thermospira aquatica]|uniref:Uncharacterized protein n=1 Tax=Thermospira aquatica TaxID=2828656 RepID=A0AAX3BB14_9SPIR|nr:hypothetical protein [Thermospira aquatica]URA09447.1 hypothetical protein KDW03_08090 [Thermospira aquatica]
MKRTLQTSLYYNLLFTVFNVWEKYAKEQIRIYEEKTLQDTIHPNLHKENLAILKNIADMIHITKKFLLSLEPMVIEGSFFSVDEMKDTILKEIKKLFEDYALPEMMFPLAEKKISQIHTFYHQFIDEITILPPDENK